MAPPLFLDIQSHHKVRSMSIYGWKRMEGRVSENKPLKWIVLQQTACETRFVKNVTM